MSALASLQADFQDYLLGRPHGMLERVRDSAKAERAVLLAVYGEGYLLRLLEVLGNDFPGLQAQLGEAAFDALGRAYIAAHPSEHPNARWFGRHLAGFVRQAAPWSAEPVLADLAALDWQVGCAFDAAEAPLLTFADLAAVPPEDWAGLRFAVVPSARRLDLASNADAIRAAATRAAPLPAAQADARPLLVWRRGLEVEILALEADAAAAFDCLQAGETFGALCEALGRFHDEEAAAMRAAGLLRAWIELEILAAPAAA